MLSRKKQIIVTILAIISGMCVAPFLLLPIYLIDEETTNKIPAIIGLVCTALLLAVCITLAYFIRNDYKIKYFFCRKSYNEQYAKLAPYFVTLSPKHKKEFDKECKITYLMTGELLNRGWVESNEIYKNREKMEVLCKMVDVLCESTKNGRGWLYFIGKCDECIFTYKHKYISDVPRDDPLDSWEIYALIGCALFSRGFRCMTNFVYHLCDFTIVDYTLSEEWTKQNEEHKEALEKEFNPILFAYKEELLEVQSKLHKGLEETK